MDPRAIVKAAQEYLDLKDGLMAHHRIGKHPSESFWRKYDKAKEQWAAVVRLEAADD